MKKILSTLALAVVFTLAFTSCKKDYTCKCTTTDSSGIIPTITQETTIENSKKDDAEDACSASTVTIGTLTTTCELE